MRISATVGAFALVAGGSFAVPASAADDGWYVVGFGGEATTRNVERTELDQNLVDLFGSVGLSVVDATSTLNDSDTGFGLAVGYQANANFAVELGYVDLGDIAYSATGTVTDGFADYDADFALDQSASGPVFSLLGIWPVGERFSVFGRVGIALMGVDADASVTIDGTNSRASASTDRSNATYGVGGELSFGNRFALRVAYDRYAGVGSDDITGDTDVDLISLGLRYTFR